MISFVAPPLVDFLGDLVTARLLPLGDRRRDALIGLSPTMIPISVSSTTFCRSLPSNCVGVGSRYNAVIMPSAAVSDRRARFIADLLHAGGIFPNSKFIIASRCAAGILPRRGDARSFPTLRRIGRTTTARADQPDRPGGPADVGEADFDRLSAHGCARWPCQSAAGNLRSGRSSSW